MRINLREGSLEATLTESRALPCCGSGLSPQVTSKKCATPRKRPKPPKTVAAERVAELATYPAADPEQTARLQGILERATAEADRLWRTQPTGRYFCLEGQQIFTAIQMCRGTFKSPVGEVSLADGYRNIRFYKDGLRIFGDSDSECSIEFPGPVLANAIEAVHENLATLIAKRHCRNRQRGASQRQVPLLFDYRRTHTGLRA